MTLQTRPRAVAIATLFSTLLVALLATLGNARQAAAVGIVYKKMFVTSTAGTGDLSSWAENTTPPSGLTGLAAGDKICQVRAENATPPLATAGVPVFRAWLSDSTTDAYCHIQGLTGKRFGPPVCDNGSEIGGGPWLLTNNTQFSGDLATLVLEAGIHEPMYDENGTLVTDSFHKSPWTGSWQYGYLRSNHCNGWTDDGTLAYTGDVGRVYNTGQWSYAGYGTCDEALTLYCFEQGTGPTPPKPAVAGALVFVSLKGGPGNFDDASWLPESGGLSGLAAADAVCVDAATGANLPNPSSFVAWISTSTVNAADRVSGNGPWKTLDGRPVATSKADLTDGSIATAIRRFENDSNAGYSSYWTGSNASGNYNGTLEDTCQDWTGTSSSDYGTEGQAGGSDASWITGGGGRCDLGNNLLCISDVVLLGWDNFETGDFRRWSAVAQ